MLLAARALGLGARLTTLYLSFEKEVGRHLPAEALAGSGSPGCAGWRRRISGTFKWVARIKRKYSGSLIIAVWAPVRKSSYSLAIAGDTTAIISRFSSQNSITWKNGLWPF